MDVLPLHDDNYHGRHTSRSAPHTTSRAPEPARAPPQKPATETTYTHVSRLSLTSPMADVHSAALAPFAVKPPKRRRTRIYPPQPSQTFLHQSRSLHTDAYASNDESDLWILPDFDEWEAEAESPLQEVAPGRSGEWGPLLARAVSSNRERLRRRLEGDGWDFVGGKYGEDVKASRDGDAGSEESVDEEFDVVVLPAVEVSC